MSEASIEPDPTAVLAAAGWDATSPPLRITSGWDNWLWRFSTADGRSHALRLYRRGGSPEGLAADAASEALAMDAARAGGLPVPRVEARGSFGEAPFFILSWRRGVPMLDYVKGHPWRLKQLARNFGRLQARLHALPPPAGMRHLDDRRLDATVSHAPLAGMLRGQCLFDTFCHLDFHPLNVLVRGTRISGLVDFTGAAIADRRMDLATTKTLLLAAPLPPGPLNPIFRQLRKVMAREWEEGYRQEAGRFPLTPLFEALAITQHLADVEEAVAEGRGWARPGDLPALRAYRAARFRDAGLAPPDD
jgi:aminoglycoside phosphotransferase (APT) family kinase protein